MGYPSFQCLAGFELIEQVRNFPLEGQPLQCVTGCQVFIGLQIVFLYIIQISHARFAQIVHQTHGD